MKVMNAVDMESMSKFGNFNICYSDDDAIFHRGRMLHSLTTMKLNSSIHYNEVTN